jgi:hypothetical protein
LGVLIENDVQYFNSFVSHTSKTSSKTTANKIFSSIRIDHHDPFWSYGKFRSACSQIDWHDKIQLTRDSVA